VNTLVVKFDGANVDSTSDGQAGAAEPLHEKFDMPFYNIYIDMEIIQALPPKKGYVSSIPFYDVGQERPARYTFNSDEFSPFDSSHFYKTRRSLDVRFARSVVD
jgi:hypothetical protein